MRTMGGVFLYIQALLLDLIAMPGIVVALDEIIKAADISHALIRGIPRAKYRSRLMGKD